MTTQTPTPSDNERRSRLEGVVEQILVRLDSLERSLDNLRIILFTGFGLMWATMVGGFTAVFVAVLSIDP